MSLMVLKVTNRIEAYIQSKVLHKTLESISLDYRRGCEVSTTEREIVTVASIEPVGDKTECVKSL